MSMPKNKWMIAVIVIVFLVWGLPMLKGFVASRKTAA